MLPSSGSPALTPKVLLHPTHLGPDVLIGGWADKGEADEEDVLGNQAKVTGEGRPGGVQPGPSTPRQLLRLEQPRGCWAFRIWHSRASLLYSRLLLVYPTLPKGQGFFQVGNPHIML